MKKFISLLLYVYSIILIIFLTLIYPFIRFKIGMLSTKALGNSSFPNEILYYEIKKQKKINEIYIWFREREVANFFLLKHLKKNFFILPGFLLYTPLNLIEKLKLNYLRVIKRTFLFKDKFQLAKKKPPLINFDKKELEHAKKICEIFKIKENDKIICAAARTSKYKKENFISPGNGDILTYLSAFEFLIKNNYKVILMGDPYDNLPEDLDQNIIKYSNSEYKNDMLDFYFVSRCDFLIQTVSGIGEIAAMMKKPRLIVNFWMLENLITFEEYCVPLIMPKKLMSLKTKKMVHYLDQPKLDFTVIGMSKKVNEKGYEIIDNTPEEILAAVKEMTELRSSGYSYSTNKNQKFWSEFNKIFSNKDDIFFTNKKIKHYICSDRINKIKIPRIFYNENISLFE